MLPRSVTQTSYLSTSMVATFVIRSSYSYSLQTQSASQKFSRKLLLHDTSSPRRFLVPYNTRTEEVCTGISRRTVVGTSSWARANSVQQTKTKEEEKANYGVAPNEKVNQPRYSNALLFAAPWNIISGYTMLHCVYIYVYPQDPTRCPFCVLCYLLVLHTFAANRRKRSDYHVTGDCRALTPKPPSTVHWMEFTQPLGHTVMLTSIISQIISPRIIMDFSDNYARVRINTVLPNYKCTNVLDSNETLQ